MRPSKKETIQRTGENQSVISKFLPQRGNTDLHVQGRDALAHNRVDSAYKLYRKALRENPNDPEFHYGMGAVLARRGKVSAAMEHLDFAINSGAAVVPDAAQLKANLEVERGRYDSARDAAQKLAKWAEQQGHSLMAVDAWLLAARISNVYLKDMPATFYNIEKARILVGAADYEAAARIKGFEEDVRKASPTRTH